MKRCGVIALLLVWLGPAVQAKQVNSASADLISPALIQRAGWTWNWQVALPVRSHEKIERMMVFDDYLYVMTDSNLLSCLDRRTGAVRFMLPLSSKKLPVCSPVYHERKLWFLVGNEMVCVDPWAGRIIVRHRFSEIGNTFECGLAMNDRYIYISAADRRLYAFSRDGFVKQFTATADNDSAIVSLSAINGKLVFATLAGNIVAIADNQPLKEWQFDATGSIRSELVTRDDMIYIGSQDAKLYKLNAATGRLAWPMPFHAGDRLREPVALGRELVYLPAGAMGVYGINQADGRTVWQAPQGIGVLTEADARSFVLSRPGVLNVFDNKTGHELYSVNFSQVKRFAVMMDEPKLYVADTGGRVAAITVR